MENKVFMSGVNFARAVTARLNSLDGLGLMGYSVVMENVVSPLIRMLHNHASVVMVDGREVDLLHDGLDGETYVVSVFKAQVVILRMREINRLLNDIADGEKYHARRTGDELVIAAVCKDETNTNDGMNGAVDEEATLAEHLIDLYDELEGGIPDEFGRYMHIMLKIAREAVDNLVVRLEEIDELTAEQFDLWQRAMAVRDDATDHILELRELHPEWMDMRCNGDCASCDYFDPTGGWNDSDEDEDSSED